MNEVEIIPTSLGWSTVQSLEGEYTPHCQIYEGSTLCIGQTWRKWISVESASKMHKWCIIGSPATWIYWQKFKHWCLCWPDKSKKWSLIFCMISVLVHLWQKGKTQQKADDISLFCALHCRRNATVSERVGDSRIRWVCSGIRAQSGQFLNQSPFSGCGLTFYCTGQPGL